jgi:homoserine kinase
MRRVRVTLPASITNLGPGLNSLGLALGLHCNVEFTDRDDGALVVETRGEGAGRYALGARHPVVIGMTRVFQHVERAVVGLTVRVDNAIPLASGLGAEAAFLVAGVVGANNLMGSPFKRDALLQFVSGVTRRADHAVTAMLGGLLSLIHI